MLSPLLLLLLNALITCVSAGTGYHERLLLRPLPQGTLLASFNFVSNETQTAFEQQNFGYFPRSFGQILQHAHAKELHLRFSVGRWDAESWGQRPWNGAREGGTGVELWAWVEADTEEEYGCTYTARREAILTQAEHSRAGSHLPTPSLACFAPP
jgi:phosphatidylinositol glycan class T